VLHVLHKGWLTYGMRAQKWHKEKFPWHATFTAVSIYFLPLLPTQRLYIVKNMHIYIYSDRT